MIVSAIISAEGETLSTPADARLPWWSFGKTVLAAAAFKLAEQGRLALDEPLGGKLYTPRQLLAHRAGLRDYGALPDYQTAVAGGEDAWPLDEMLARARADELLFTPGTAWRYSNIGYALIRREIERATDSELRSALHATVFAPLGVHAHMTRKRDDMQRVPWPRLHGYDPNWVYHGLILGTAADAARFLHRLFTLDLLSPASRQAMFDSLPVTDPLSGRPFGAPRMGTGLMIDAKGPHGPWFGHTGGGPGSGCAVYRFPDMNRTVAVFADVEDDGAVERAALALAAP